MQAAHLGPNVLAESAGHSRESEPNVESRSSSSSSSSTAKTEGRGEQDCQLVVRSDRDGPSATEDRTHGGARGSTGHGYSTVQPLHPVHPALGTYFKDGDRVLDDWGTGKPRQAFDAEAAQQQRRSQAEQYFEQNPVRTPIFGRVDVRVGGEEAVGATRPGQDSASQQIQRMNPRLLLGMLPHIQVGRGGRIILPSASRLAAMNVLYSTLTGEVLLWTSIPGRLKCSKLATLFVLLSMCSLRGFHTPKFGRIARAQRKSI